MKLNLVFEGGGILGLSYVGALKALDEKDIEINKIAGTSVGSLFAALIAAGYTNEELEDIVCSYDFNLLKGKNMINVIPYFGKTMSLLVNKGIYSTTNLEKWIDKLLKDKGVTSFNDLDKELKVIVADVTNKKVAIFPDDLDKYNLPIDYPLSKIVTMSCCIPIYFKPYKLNNTYMVDGGVIANYPIWAFKDDEIDTLGFLIKNKKDKSYNKNLFSYISSVMETMVSRDDFLYNYNYGKERTISIEYSELKATDFEIDCTTKKTLISKGYKDTLKFFSKRLT